MNRAAVFRWSTRVAECAIVSVAISASVASSASADNDPPLHRVVYTVTADQPVTAGIYYRDVDPSTWADYSHNPYQFSPRDDVRLGPDTPWVHEAMLADPAQWAMVTVTTVGQPSPDGQTLRCQLSVDGVEVARGQGARGALCSLRHW
jgi:hypothetical protein